MSSEAVEPRGGGRSTAQVQEPDGAWSCQRNDEQHCEPKPDGHSGGELPPADEGMLARRCCQAIQMQAGE